jgi:N6-adenosine-specific RNA methylase IME4
VNGNLFAELSPPYSTIVADPPWHYTEQDRQGRAMPYSTMTLDEIMRLPVGEIARPGAHLYLWTTNRYLFDSRDVALSWGFAPTQVLVWAKPPGGTKPVGRFSSTTEFIVHGHKPVHGHVRKIERAGSLIKAARESAGLGRADLHRAVRGGQPTGIVFRWEADESLPTETDWKILQSVLPSLSRISRPEIEPPPQRDPVQLNRVNTSWWEWSVGGHSIKPPAFLDVVEQVSPGPYVELFARQPRLGWDAWGHGYELVASP